METPSPRDSRAGLAMVAAAATAWGTIPLLVRRIDPIHLDAPFLSSPLDVSPALTVFWRVALATLAIGGYLVVSGRLRDTVRLPRRALVALALNGFLLAAHWVLFFSALVLTDVAVAEILTYTGPIYVAALTPAVLGERFDARVLLPVGLALAGIGVILGPDLGALEGTGNLAGAGAAIVAAFSFALLMLNAKKLLAGLPPLTVTFHETFWATVLLLPLALLLPSPDTPAEWASIATLGLVHSVLVVLVFMAGLRRIRADHASVLMYAEPVSAVVLAAAFLGEPVDVSTALGGALVVVAGALVARMARVPGVEGPFVDVGVEGRAD